MASYRPFPAQSTFPPPPPNQQPSVVPPPQQQQQQQQQQQRPNQYNQNFNQMAPPPHASSAFQQNYPQMPPQQNFPQHYPPPRGQHPPLPPSAPHQQYPYQPPPPPPPPPAADSGYPPPPLPPAPPQQQQHNQAYYTSQYPQYGHQPMQPPPPPLPPSSPGSSMPPPPPPSSPPPPPPKESGLDRDKGLLKDRKEHGHSNHGVSNKEQQQKPPAPSAMKKVNGQSVRVETEEERRLRKRKEYERQRHEEKHRNQVKESQNSVMQKAQVMSMHKGHGSIVGSRMGDRRATPLLSGERIENRLKKPTTFLCKLKFRNELPDPSAQPKLMKLKRDEDRFTRYTITSLEKNYKPQLYVEPDLGIPLDLLDLSVYNPSGSRLPLAPEDEELLRDDEAITPVKKDGIRRKERPTDKGVAWLVKTQYISSISAESTKQSLTEKQAKELREMKGGRNLLGNVNDRERQIKEIQASFEACRLPPVHATNKNLRPVEVLPVLPDLDRYEDKFVMAGFDSAPTADSEIYNKLDQSVRDACESRAVMKACVATGLDPANPEKFLAYMAPLPNELPKDMYDENEDISYSWLREYHWDVRGDDANDPTTFLVAFDEAEARYLPLPTKISLRKKRAAEGRAGDEIEHFPVPSKVTVRRRPTAATIELRDSWVNSNSRGHVSKISRYDDDDDDDDVGRVHRVSRHQDMNHSSGAEDDLSE